MLTNYLDWLITKALPVWTARGFDERAQRFHERLDNSGDPVAVPHRAMVQARQIFVFAHAARRGWSKDGALLAERAMASLIRDFAIEGEDETSFAFAIDPVSNEIIAPQRDAYAHAFVLFALAELYRLNGDTKLLAIVDRTIRFIERGLRDPHHGGLFDALPAPTEKRQNPHMHLLEAYLVLAQAAPGHGYEERAAALVALFRHRFLREGVVLEYFQSDWSVTHATWEPGHHFEWVWLLKEFNSLTGDPVQTEIDLLYGSATRSGLAANGLVVDELSPEGIALKSSHRIWPHCEAIKAAAVCRDMDLANRMADGLTRHFLDRPFVGGWIDHIAPDGSQLVDYVPASTLYHLILAGSVAAKSLAVAPTLAKTEP